MNDAVRAKRERGKKRYDARYKRIGEQMAAKNKTQSSDIAPKRINDGIKPDHNAIRIHQQADKIVQHSRKRNPLAFLEFLSNNVDSKKDEPHEHHQHIDITQKED